MAVMVAQPGLRLAALGSLTSWSPAPSTGSPSSKDQGSKDHKGFCLQSRSVQENLRSQLETWAVVSRGVQTSRLHPHGSPAARAFVSDGHPTEELFADAPSNA